MTIIILLIFLTLNFLGFKKHKIKIPKLIKSKNKVFYLGIGNPNLEPVKKDLEVKNVNQITQMLRGNNFKGYK